MEKVDYTSFDWHRIFIGEVPGTFFIEVIIRTVIIYFILITAIRLMGKRMALQLNVTEMTAMVTLAAAIGVPMQAPDKGVLPAVVIALVVVFCERILSKWARDHQQFEKIIHGDINVLIEDAVINFECLQHVGMSKELVMEQVRAHGLDHLGKVKRMYMESSGAFSIVKEEEGRPGLSVIPADDANYWQEQEFSLVRVCGNCGNLKQGQPEESACPACHRQEWVQAVG